MDPVGPVIGPLAPQCEHCEGPTVGNEAETGWPYGPTYFTPERTMMSPGWLCISCLENAEETERDYARRGWNERAEW